MGASGVGHGSMCGAGPGIRDTGEGVWGPDADYGAGTGWCVLCLGLDVPDLRAVTVDRGEGLWQGVLLWFIFMRIFHGAGTHTAAAGADQSRRRAGAADGTVG